jgi:hypothetical protein
MNEGAVVTNHPQKEEPRDVNPKKNGQRTMAAGPGLRGQLIATREPPSRGRDETCDCRKPRRIAGICRRAPTIAMRWALIELWSRQKKSPPARTKLQPFFGVALPSGGVASEPRTLSIETMVITVSIGQGPRAG